MFSNKTTYYLIYICILFLGCNRSVYTKTGAAGLHTFDSSVSLTSSKADKLIQPYRDQIQEEMGATIGYTALAMTKNRPEGLLGNAVCDLVLQYTREFIDSTATICVMNHGGLRAPLPKGPITKGKVYELMPFDNTISVLRLNREQLNELANHIINRGGEPIGGIDQAKIVKRDGGASFTFASDANNNQKVYTVVTSNYLADGGDNFTVYKKASYRNDSPILIRDALLYAFAKYTSEANPLNAALEGRIPLTNE